VAGSVLAVYLSPDDAKTDVILAAATTTFGVAARGFVVSLPLYPRQGLLAAALDVVWILAITALVPVLLARYRGDGAAAFGLDGGRGGLRAGLLIALPVVALGVVLGLRQAGTAGTALLGRIGLIGAFGGSLGVSRLLLVIAEVMAFSVGALLLVAFLSVRGREGFPRSPDGNLAGLVRTAGLVTVGVAAVLGLLLSLGGGSVVVVLANVVALVALLLLTDRLVPAGTTVPRAVIATPMVVVVITHVLASGGIFRGDLAGGLYTAALALGSTIAIAALAQSRHRAWAAVPLIVAVHWWPTCLSPLTLAGGIC
jgi:hypothetical protein